MSRQPFRGVLWIIPHFFFQRFCWMFFWVLTVEKFISVLFSDVWQLQDMLQPKAYCIFEIQYRIKYIKPSVFCENWLPLSSSEDIFSSYSTSNCSKYETTSVGAYFYIWHTHRPLPCNFVLLINSTLDHSHTVDLQVVQTHTPGTSSTFRINVIFPTEVLHNRCCSPASLNP